jgi:hypothetical protein
VPKGRSLVIEPGTRALVIDEGILVGEVPPGEYTLESFVERLQFWRKRQATIFLTRCEDVPVDSDIHNVPCLDGVCFDVSYRWTVQISDILSFMDNLMGAKESVSIEELEELLSPIIGQAAYSAIGQSSYDEVQSADFVTRLADGIRSRADVKLQRYGLDFVDLQTARCSCDDGGVTTPVDDRSNCLTRKVSPRGGAGDPVPCGVGEDRLQTATDKQNAGTVWHQSTGRLPRLGHTEGCGTGDR